MTLTPTKLMYEMMMIFLSITGTVRVIKRIVSQFYAKYYAMYAKYVSTNLAIVMHFVDAL